MDSAVVCWMFCGFCVIVALSFSFRFGPSGKVVSLTDRFLSWSVDNSGNEEESNRMA